MINTYMRNYFKTLKKSAGFTLIELLVVIGILGVLAAALIATIDPFEQIKKANDANKKNVAVEFLNANIRYYTTHNAMPWGDNASCATTGTLSDASAINCLTTLIADGELKGGFTTATNVLNQVQFFGGSNEVTACFLPESKSQQRDPNTKYNASGVLTTGCAGQSGGTATNCYWCSL
ncbi:MAG: prepilin-type N-terminal cleavage/methylation domain-containing protein [Candidatus Levybacteria bacterium]|nr:prepilin-type N-terminal cleavage/methylation domain-containing protein [Candidatus Levybacteria bacterium]